MFSGNVSLAREDLLAEKWTSPRPPVNGYNRGDHAVKLCPRVRTPISTLCRRHRPGRNRRNRRFHSLGRWRNRPSAVAWQARSQRAIKEAADARGILLGGCLGSRAVLGAAHDPKVRPASHSPVHEAEPRYRHMAVQFSVHEQDRLAAQAKKPLHIQKAISPTATQHEQRPSVQATDESIQEGSQPRRARESADQPCTNRPRRIQPLGHHAANPGIARRTTNRHGSPFPDAYHPDYRGIAIRAGRQVVERPLNVSHVLRGYPRARLTAWNPIAGPVIAEIKRENVEPPAPEQLGDRPNIPAIGIQLMAVEEYSAPIFLQRRQIGAT